MHYNFSRDKLSAKLTKTCIFELAVLIYANIIDIHNQSEKSITVDRIQQALSR
jgi:hypothetical protein